MFTVDDVLISIMFMTSLSLYLALEYKKPLKNNVVFVDKKKQPAASQSKQKISTKKLNTNLKLDSIEEYGDSDLD